MKKSQLRVSLVIPAYNEESHLRACLKAAFAQSEPFYEVIVVDNNSTDKTAEIARSFGRVRLLSEPLQGKVFARTAALNAARGDIIARIDADTHLHPAWSANVRRLFESSDVAAVSGRPEFYDIAWGRLCTSVENACRRLMAYALRDTIFLQGANMAVRRGAWEAVRDELCSDRRIHEDFDIAIHLQQHGYPVTYDTELVAGLSARCLDVNFGFFVGYVLMNSRTYALHRVPHYRRMYPVIALVLLLFWPARAILRGTDPATGRFSWVRLFAPRAVSARVTVTGGVYLS